MSIQQISTAPICIVFTLCKDKSMLTFSIDGFPPMYSIFRSVLPYNLSLRDNQYFGKCALRVGKFSTSRNFRYSANNEINVMGGD